MLFCICFLLITVLLSIHSTYAVVFSEGSCQSLPATSDARKFNPCAKVVTYSFYVFPGSSLTTLQAKANAALNNSLLMQYPDFAPLYVNYACAKIYLQCQPNVVLSDTATYNTQVYQALGQTFGIPFQIPCMSVCSSMLIASPTLVKLLFGMSGTFCTATYDYSYGAITAVTPLRFDATNTAGQCFTATTLVVGGPVETYHGSFCKGIVNKIFIPPANKLLPSLAALQEPGTVQALIEFGLSSRIVFPPYLTPECRLGLRQYACYLGFINPQPVNLQHALLYSNLGASAAFLNAHYPGLTAGNLTLPSYADKSYCLNYKEVCADLISLSSTLPSDCEILSPTSTSDLPVQVFPAQEQIVSTIQTSFGLVKFATKPTTNEYYNPIEYGDYAPKCPNGFVVPEHPDDENIQWVPGTACASACRSRLWEDKEWDMFDKLTLDFPAAGAFFSLVTLAYLIVTREVHNYYLAFIYTLINLTASLKSIQFHRSGDIDERLCYDNAINQMQDYGNGSECVGQGATLTYCILTSCGLILAIVIQWLLQAYRKKEIFYHPAYYVFQFMIIFVLPMIPVIYAGVKNEFGFSKTGPGYCMLVPTPFAKKNDNVALLGTPVFVGYATAYLIFLSAVIYRQIVPPLEPHPEDSWLHKVERRFDPYVMIVMFSAIIFIPFIIAQFLTFLWYDEYIQSFTDWAKCVFLNYDGSDESYVEACGLHAKERPTFALVNFQVFLLTGNMILIGPIFIFFHLFQRNFDIRNIIREKYGWKQVLPESDGKDDKYVAQVQQPPLVQDVEMVEAKPADEII